MAKRQAAAALGAEPGSSAFTAVQLCSGALAGAASWAVALPADVVKSRIQAAPLGSPPQQLRMAAVAAAVLQEGGPRAFFKGFVPCVLRSLPVNAVTFFAYEECLQLASSRFPLPE